MTKAAAASSHDRTLVPFLKWAGGKRWLTSAVRSVMPDIEFIDGKYIEPFLGGGAMFFALRPRSAILNDLNSVLINTYRAIKADPKGVIKHLGEFQAKHSKKYYYEARSQRGRSKVSEAARFLYLNRTCWNGLYRVNLRGEFNVPVGTKSEVVLDTDDFELVSRRLRGARLMSMDFEAVVAKAGDGDLVFADPPYTVNHNLNGFLKYNERLFSWDDQVRLRDSLKSAVTRGARVVLSNADHDSIRALYSGRVFKILVMPRFSRIAGDRDKRKAITELLIVGGE